MQQNIIFDGFPWGARSFFRLVFLSPLLVLFIHVAANAQDSTRFKWAVTSTRTAPGHYTLRFATDGKDGWQLYGPKADLGDGLQALHLELLDSSIRLSGPIRVEGKGSTIKIS